MRRSLLWASLLLLMPSLHATTIVPIDTPTLSLGCTRTTRASLSPVAAEVLSRIENNPDAIADSPVPVSKILSTCNAFNSFQLDGPNIFAAARDLIATADHEVDMVFFKWEAGSNGSHLIGDGLIAAQARRTPSDPLLVRMIIDDAQDDYSRMINHLYDAQKDWVSRGLDLSRVQIQLSTSPRSTRISPILHDKLVVVDGRRVLVTGSQPQKSSDPLSPDGTTGWHDSGYAFDGDVAQGALASFDHAWTVGSVPWDCQPRSLGSDCVERWPFPAANRSWLLPYGTWQPGDIPLLAVGRIKGGQFDNNTHNPEALAWLTVMDHATTVLNIESPNINDDAFRAAVVRAIGRGVTVRLITSLGFNDESADLPSQGGDNMEVVGNLHKEIRATYPWYQDRFQLRWYSPDGIDPILGTASGANHTKYMTADSSIAIVGSGNQDTPSWNMSHELNVLIDDAPSSGALDQSLFLPDWNKSVSSYLELYEGNAATQDVVCPIWTTRNRYVFFNTSVSDYSCDNDEARSMLLHDVPAGKVFRFFDDPNAQPYDDDWTEVFVKRAISRKVLDTFEQTFEDDDVRVVYHRNDGLDGKISAMNLSDTRTGAVVDLYEGNGATQNLVCSTPISGTPTLNFQSDPHCNNDEARSLVLYDWPADKALFFYDDPSGSRSDDYTVIIPKHALSKLTVSSFESSYQTTDVRVCAVHFNGIDGKVSRMRIGSIAEATSYCPTSGGGGTGGGTQPQ